MQPIFPIPTEVGRDYIGLTLEKTDGMEPTQSETLLRILKNGIILLIPQQNGSHDYTRPPHIDTPSPPQSLVGCQE